MKKITFAILIFLICSSLYSQAVNPKTSVALFIGGLFPISGQAGEIYPSKGINAGLEFFIWKNKFGVYTDLTFNYCKTDFNKYGDPYLTYLSNPGYYIMKFSLGPRWLIGKGRIYGSIDLGVGAYFRKNDGYSYKDTRGNITTISATKFRGPGIGTNLGGMLNFAVSKNLEFTVKSKFNLIGFPPVGELYFELAGGLGIKL